MAETTPIFDEIHRFMDTVKAQAPAIESALQKAGRAFEGWHVHIEQWGKQFGKNQHQHMFGNEFQSPEELRRQALREKRRKERENCLHGRSPFPIHMGLGVRLQCPQCYGFSIHVGSERLFCFICGWKQWRIGKRPS